MIRTRISGQVKPYKCEGLFRSQFLFSLRIPAAVARDTMGFIEVGEAENRPEVLAESLP
jgi:hypothetical protein